MIRPPRGSRHVVATAAALATLAIPGVAAAAPPANDDFSSRIVIGSLPFSDSRVTDEATIEGGEPESPCASTPDSHSVWYEYTPPTDTFLVADTLNSDYDTVIAVYTGGTLGTLSEVTCVDDSFGLLTETGFTASGGTSYKFQVEGYDTASGNLEFHLATMDFKVLTLRAKPRKVESGDRTKLTASFTPCAGHEGDPIAFSRGSKRIATKASNSACTSSLKTRVKERTTFSAEALPTADDIGSDPDSVKVRVKT